MRCRGPLSKIAYIIGQSGDLWSRANNTWSRPSAGKFNEVLSGDNLGLELSASGEKIREQHNIDSRYAFGIRDRLVREMVTLQPLRSLLQYSSSPVLLGGGDV